MLGHVEYLAITDFLDCLILEISYFETSVTTYQYTHRNIPQDFNLQHQRWHDTKSRKL
jgi:hypothetical protein